jgi:hypothetical protein
MEKYKKLNNSEIKNEKEIELLNKLKNLIIAIIRSYILTECICSMKKRQNLSYDYLRNMKKLFKLIEKTIDVSTDDRSFILLLRGTARDLRTGADRFLTIESLLEQILKNNNSY